MTAHGRYAANDGSMARSTGNAAARGSALIAVAVVIGFLLLWKGGVGGDSSAAVDVDDSGADTQTDDGSADDGSADDGAADDGSADDGSADDGTGEDSASDATVDDTGAADTTSTTLPATPTTRPLGEVKVAVVNGVGEAGLAGGRSEILKTAGYVVAAANAASSPVEVSNVFYIEGYAEDARGVAEELGGAVTSLRVAPEDPLTMVDDPTGIEDFQIFVILGADRELG